jgi:glycosyltransferase involved in cell wall biosynthesis
MGAYVHRLPQTERRAAKEEELFPHSRARYQDKFCSLKLTGKSDRYEPTCRGEFCEHFAPPAMIRIHEPLAGRAVSAVKTARVPRASCVMVTGGREAFLRQAILYFSRQDYPEKELVIVDDGPRDLSAELGPAGIRYLHVAPGLSIGEKRNRGCELATGEYIVQWDDDDWHGPGRLGRQVTPMLRGEADITALRTELVFDLEHWRFWTMSDGVHRRMFVEDVHGGTLAFRREVWDRGVRYPDTSLAEDAQFLRRAIEQGARLKRARNEGAFIYLRHGSNAWSFQCGREVDSRGWKVVPEPAHLRSDRQFYLALRRQRRSVPSPACRSIRDPGGPRFHPNANGAG